MSGLTSINFDPIANQPQFKSPTPNFFDHLQLGLEAFGPAGMESLAYGFGTSSSEFGIGSAAINSLFASSSALGTGSFSGGSPQLTTGGFSGLTTNNGYSGSTSYLGGSPSNLNTDPGGGDLEGMLAQGAMDQAYLIGIQQQVAQSNLQFQSMSTVMNMAHQGQRAAIQNMKV